MYANARESKEDSIGVHSRSLAVKEQIALFDFRGRQIKGWAKKHIWGDNKPILSSLKNGRCARRSSEYERLIIKISVHSRL